ncbi:MAG: NTP transferase domain-containing protein [Candidatus Limnocylindrales bacterium]
MTQGRAGVAAVVLAAGAGSRFGGGKLLASLEGRPILQHVLDALAAAGLTNVVVVLGDDAEAMETALHWRSARRVRNPDPARGLASSLQVGLAAAEEGSGASRDAALIVLGDQPELRAEAIEAILSAGDGTHAIVPRYEHDRGRNPVLLPAGLWRVARGLSGDQGLGAWLVAHPEHVREVALSGANPDVDRRADLAELAWARRVRANREQVDRFREVPDGADFYASTSSIFRADPDRTDDDVANVLLGLARPTDVWLDIGAGAGRYALPLARHVRQVVAVEPSPGMAAALAEVAAEHGIGNVRQVGARWPMAGAPAGDAALMAHVGYDIQPIGAFLDAMEAAAPRRVALLMEQQPAMAAAPFWAAIYDEPRIPLPALPEFLDLLDARGARPTVTRLPVTPARYGSFDEMLAFLRRQTWVATDGPRDRLLVETARATAVETPEGWRLPAEAPTVGIVTWGAWGRRVR